MVEAASEKFVVVVDDSKLVSGLEEVDAKLRLDGNRKPYVTDNSNYIVDLYFKTPIKDSVAAGKEIVAFEGVVEHGLFLDMTIVVIIAGKEGVSVKSK
ncbi:putative ribose-5-phosphate isomerase 3, chloroplastic [Capsicum chinense]|nr:putative ribose-5-phosphate isomerase 3, chloroplastic [Capsicum chinense]